jgi:hypothetical protein
MLNRHQLDISAWLDIKKTALCCIKTLRYFICYAKELVCLVRCFVQSNYWKVLLAYLVFLHVRLRHSWHRIAFKPWHPSTCNSLFHRKIFNVGLLFNFWGIYCFAHICNSIFAPHIFQSHIVDIFYIRSFVSFSFVIHVSWTGLCLGGCLLLYWI